MIRNVFPVDKTCRDVNDDDWQWKLDLKQFDNGVPRFHNVEDAVAFSKKHANTGSNPDYPQMKQNVTTFVGWNQLSTYIFPVLNRPSKLSSFPQDKIYSYLVSRLELPIHQHMDVDSCVMNTFRYLHDHMKCGIFVRIRDKRVAIFAPFVNDQYRNTWTNTTDFKITTASSKMDKSDLLSIISKTSSSMIGTTTIQQMDVAQYYRNKKRDCGDKAEETASILPKEQWWANGNIVCNQACDQYWGDHFLLTIKDMLAETCRSRPVADCDFFFNKRDFPQLKFNAEKGCAVEPYGFMFDKEFNDDIPLSRCAFDSYCPILSFYTSSPFADIPVPVSEDWEAATGNVFCSSFQSNTHLPRDMFLPEKVARFDCSWSDKIETAFFRGTATGSGVSIATNQRLHLAYLSASMEGTGILDCGIVGWNFRDKKVGADPMQYIRIPTNLKKKGFVPMYQQCRYKYLVYVQGHSAACRYGFMMRLNSVILKVASTCAADQMWYFPMLRPFYDHIPVKSDLSDIVEKIEWCRAHDMECQQIARNARALFDRYISRDGIMDYMQTVFAEIGKRQKKKTGDENVDGEMLDDGVNVDDEMPRKRVRRE
jgi:hypothetical protein